MRVFLLAATLCLLPGACLADREIFIPTGTKLPFGQMRLEYLLRNRNGKEFDAFAAFGVTKQLEAEFQLEQLTGTPRLGTFSFSFTPFTPITDTLPGLSIGVRDVLDRTDEGRLYYLATTFRIGTEGERGADYLDINLGVGHGKTTKPFVGVVLPLSPKLQLLGEHDGTNATGGIEFRPVQGLGIRWLAREHQTFWSVRWTTRF